MIDFGKVRERTLLFLSTRDGFNNYHDFDRFVNDLTGILCNIALAYECDTNCIIGFLDSLEGHELKPIPTDGKLRHFDSIVNEHVSGHVLHKPFSEEVMKWIPGSVQAGKGEALFCVYDQRSIFGTSPRAGFDVVVDLKSHEFKAIPNNQVRPEDFDNYTSDNITIIKGMSFASTRKDDWRTMCYFYQTDNAKKKDYYSLKLLT